MDACCTSMSIGLDTVGFCIAQRRRKDSLLELREVSLMKATKRESVEGANKGTGEASAEKQAKLARSKSARQ